MSFNFSHTPYEARIGRNPENADMGNPTGVIFERRWSVDAYNDDGEVYTYFADIETEERAMMLVALFERQHCRGDLDPSAHLDWSFNRYAYGSEAYLENYQEEEYARMDEEERANYGRW